MDWVQALGSGARELLGVPCLQFDYNQYRHFLIRNLSLDSSHTWFGRSSDPICIKNLRCTQLLRISSVGEFCCMLEFREFRGVSKLGRVRGLEEISGLFKLVACNKFLCCNKFVRHNTFVKKFEKLLCVRMWRILRVLSLSLSIPSPRSETICLGTESESSLSKFVVVSNSKLSGLWPWRDNMCWSFLCH